MSNLKVLAKQVADAVVDFNFKVITNSLNRITDGWFNTGIFISTTALVSGDNRLPHGLNRTPKGCLFTKVGAGVTLFWKADQNDPSHFFVINASSNVTTPFECYLF